MVEGRREFEGRMVAHLIRCIPVAVWAPAELLKAGDLSPFPKPESEAVKEFKAKRKAKQWRAMTGGG